MDDAKRAVERAVRSLAVRAHSEQELVEKLTRAGYEEQVIAEAMAKLAKHGLLDDAGFAAGWAASRARKGMGPYRIAQELRMKGIDRETIDAVLADMDEDSELEAAAALALKHLRKGDERAKRRAYEAMVRRGYGYDTAREALTLAEQRLSEEEGL